MTDHAKPKLRRGTSPEAQAFWKSVRESVATLEGQPDWMRAGVTIDPEIYETGAPAPSAPEDGGRRA